MKSYKSVLAGEWFDGLSLGDDTYFMLNLQNHRQCPAGGFYLSGLRQCFDGSPVQGPTQWRAGSWYIPVNPSHRRQWVGDFALQDAFQALFPSILRERLATFSCRHRFVHLSFMNKSAFAEMKLWASSAAFAFGGRTVEFARQTSGTACGSSLPGLRAPSRTGAGAVCASDVGSP
jgi:hypothetical protein